MVLLSQATAGSCSGNWPLPWTWLVWGSLKVWGCERKSCILRCWRMARRETPGPLQLSEELWFLNCKNRSPVFSKSWEREFLRQTEGALTRLALSAVWDCTETKELSASQCVHRPCVQPCRGSLEDRNCSKMTPEVNEKENPYSPLPAKWLNKENPTRERLYIKMILEKSPSILKGFYKTFIHFFLSCGEIHIIKFTTLII